MMIDVRCPHSTRLLAHTAASVRRSAFAAMLAAVVTAVPQVGVALIPLATTHAQQ